MNRSSIAFAELLCAKMCELLSNTVSAVNSGVAFLGSSTIETQARAFEFINIKAQESVNKLAFLKQAYGFMHSGYETNIETVDFLIKTFLHGTDMSCDITSTTQDSLDMKLAKLIYNLVIMISELISNSGHLKIAMDNQLVLTSSHEAGLAEFDSTWLLGHYDHEDLSSSTVQAAYTGEIARHLGCHIKIKQEPGRLEITVTQP